MNYGLILAGGVGQRMRSSGMPKQFLEVFGKPVIIYTLEKFEKCVDIDRYVIVCNASWINHMETLVKRSGLKKLLTVVPGGKNRQDSVKQGLIAIQKNGSNPDDIIAIHDGVRPLVQIPIISENVRMAQKYGCAMTVKPVIETVCVTPEEAVCFEDFKKRDDTYTLTAPQTFRLKVLTETMSQMEKENPSSPILDAAIGYAYLGGRVHIVRENNNNLKITTPEDYYIMKALLELEENKVVFGI